MFLQDKKLIWSQILKDVNTVDRIAIFSDINISNILNYLIIFLSCKEGMKHVLKWQIR